MDSAVNDMVGKPVQVQDVGKRQSLSQSQQVSALLQKNLRIHLRVNACPCIPCCGPGRSIPFVVFNPCLLHFFCPIVFVIMITWLPWYVVKTTTDDPDSFLQVVYEKGTVVKEWPGIPVGAEEGALYNVGGKSGPYELRGYPPYWQSAAGGVGSMTLPAAHHLFAPKSRSTWSWENTSCVDFPVSCHCQTLALVGPDAAVDAFKAFLEAEYARFATEVLPNETEMIMGRREDSGNAGSAQQGVPLARRLTEAARAAYKALEEAPDFLASGVAGMVARRLAGGNVNTTFDLYEERGGGQQEAEGGRAGYCNPHAVVREQLYCDVDAGHNGPIFRRFASAEEVDRWIDSEHYGHYHRDRSATSDIDRLCGAVIFENDVRTEARPKYTLRFNVTDPSAAGLDVSGSLTSRSIQLGEEGDESTRWYYTSGFLALQGYVQQFVGKERGAAAGSELYRDPSFFPMPTGGSELWPFGELAGLFLQNQFTIALMFGAIPSSIAFYIARERQTRQRELMRMMGMSDSALTISWLLMFVGFNLVITMVMTLFFKGFLLKKTDVFLLWMALWWFSNAVVTFGMVVAAFVTSDRMSAMMAFGALFGSSFLTLAVQAYDTHAKKVLMSLFPTVGFYQTLQVTWELEKVSGGLSFSNVNTHIGNFDVGTGILMLFLDFWLYLGIYYYVDNVATWHNVGVGRPLWFCCLGSYWREVTGRPPLVEGLTAEEQEAGSQDQYFESEDDAHLKSLVESDRCVLIRGLHKTFRDADGNSITAVNNLNLTMYQDECFCLLGHNGAGKTTTMMMLTGCLPQSAGTIKVRGSQVPEQLRSVRSDMGFCPQHNVLVDELTVFEHLLLFGKLGGMSREDLVKRGQELLTAVALMDKMHARSSALSGGMKRKLSCALAFLSNPYLVILDEPSSGMDPFARRGMWDTLKQWRTGHILCLTTHYMDEADALGDRIAIMSEGRLACSGSSAFLKREFGCGYVVSFAKRDGKEGREAQDAKILRTVKDAVGPAARIVSSVGKELLVQVPFDVAGKLPPLFAVIDGQRERLGVEAYGTSVTNLEEVFIKVAQISRASKKGASAESLGQAETSVEVAPTEEEEGGFFQRFMIQLGALMIRRFRHAYRNRLSCCCQVGMPVMCVFAFFLIIAITTVHALPKLLLDTSAWNADVSGGVKVPLTVASIRGDAQMDAMMGLWQSMPGADGVRLEQVNASSAGPIAGGLAEEGAFVRSVLANQHLHEASQFGAVLYPNQSSWCPASYGACTAPGPTVAVNTTAIHAAPVLLGMHGRAALGGEVEFELANHPFQKTRQQKDVEEFVSGIFAAIVIMAAYGFVPSEATSYVVMEKEKDVKHQLVISGCNQTAYWLSNFLFDILWGLVPVCGAWITFVIFGIDNYVGYPGMNASVALFLAFLPAMAGFAYIFSFLFSRAGVALFVSWIFNLTFGFIALMLVFILSSFPSLYDTSLLLNSIFRFVPIYDLGYGHLRASIYQRDAEKRGYGPLSGSILGGEWCPPEEEWGDRRREQVCQYMVGDEFLLLLVTGVLWFGLTLLVDVVFGLPIVRKVLSLSGKSPAWLQSFAARADAQDDLVTAEQERVKTLDARSQFVYVNGIHKVYGSGGGTHAVRGISFAADEGQVFGLLGVNGAGKTTTFKMLCGQVEPSAGEVRIQGYDVTTHAAQARKHIGYCPQFDALLESLTPREHLFLYGRLKGLRGARCAEAVRGQLGALDLEGYASSRAGQLSGGNKRKLSVAMATIGEPPMVFLDEPSAGMDPVARRGMWAVIQGIADRRKKSVVILTTHSMDEAEALCSRIAIQVDGQFRCLGTPQQIKSRYGEGLELNVRFSTPTHEEIAACCAQLQTAERQTLEAAFAAQEVTRVFGERVCGELRARSGSPLGFGSVGAAVLAEWVLLVQRAQAFEAFVYAELSQDAPDPSVPLCVVLEKSQNVARYQITSAALQGRFKSLGALFNTFQENKGGLLVGDFHLCQTSLEQVFNRFATMQASQMQQARPSPAQVAPEQAAQHVGEGAP